MSDDEIIGLMLRLPITLRDKVLKIAQGDRTRPKSSLNATIVFLLEDAAERFERRAKDKESSGNSAALQNAV